MSAILAALSGRAPRAWEFRLFVQHPSDCLLTALIEFTKAKGKLTQRADVYLSLPAADLGCKLRDVKTSWTREKQGAIVGELIEVKQSHETANLAATSAAPSAAGAAGAVAAAPCHALSKNLVRVDKGSPFHRAYEEEASVFVLKERMQGQIADTIDTEVTFLTARLDPPTGAGPASRPLWSSGWVSACLEHDSLSALEPFAIELQLELQRILEREGGAGSAASTALFCSYPQWTEHLRKRAAAGGRE